MAKVIISFDNVKAAEFFSLWLNDQNTLRDYNTWMKEEETEYPNLDICSTKFISSFSADIFEEVHIETELRKNPNRD